MTTSHPKMGVKPPLEMDSVQHGVPIMIHCFHELFDSNLILLYEASQSLILIS
jgi:hypothetical protein